MNGPSVNRTTIAATVLFSAATAAVAQEQVLFEVQGKDTVLGTIRPYDEQEAIVGNLVAGTVVKAAVKSTQKSGPIPTLQILKDGVPVAAAQIVVKGRGSTLAPLVIDASGTYKVLVAGDGTLDGDYQLDVSWTPQKAFAGTGTSAGDTTFAFSVPAHSVVSVALAAAKGSPFVPHLVELDGPAMAAIPLSGAKAAGLALAQRGDWTLHFKSDAADGAYRVSVKVAPPKVAKHKADIRDTALNGTFGGGSNVHGAVVTPGDGGTVDVNSLGSPIDGASVTVPPGSLGQTTSIFVAAAAPFTPPGSDHPAGPAVEFGPSGTQFDPSKPATVTIPFDVNAFPGGTGALVVYVKDSKGKIAPVLPTSSYVFGANTVTFTTSHFSTFQAATSTDRGPPSGDYALLRVTGTPTGALGGEVNVSTGFVSLQNGTVSGSTDEAVLTFSSGLIAGTQAGTSGRSLTVEGSMLQVSDSTTAVTSMTGPFRLRRGITDDVLLMEHDAGLQLGVGVLLRLTAGTPTLNTVAGQWHAFLWEFKAGTAGSGHVPLFACADAGTATISATGATQIHFTGNVRRFTSYPGGDWNVDTPISGFANGTVGFNSDHLMMFAFGSQPQFDLTSVLGGDMLFAKLRNVDTNFGPSDAQVGLLVFVRESAAASAANVLGQCVDVNGGLTLHVPDGNPAPDQLGLQWQAQTGTDVLGAGGAYSHDALLCLSGYDASGAQPVNSTTRAVSAAGTRFKLAADGAFSVSAASIVGAALPAGNVIFYLQRDTTTLAPGFILRLPPPPP